MEKKKIIIGITSLTYGGAERVLVDIVNKLCEDEEYNITIMTIYAKGELEKQLSKKVTLQSLYPFCFEDASELQKKIILPIKMLLFKNKIYEKEIKKGYDIEIAFLEGAITRIFSKENKKTKKIAWVHNDISAVFGKGIKAKIKKWIDKKVYEKYDKIIFVSRDNQEKFEKIYDIPNEKQVIHNYINDEQVKEKAEQGEATELKTTECNLITVARLVEQKAIDRLVQVHSNLKKQGLHHKIYVIGEGPERIKIEQEIKKEGVEDTFILLGKKENPYPYIKKADAFILTSYYEGYPMVILEAKILECYIIITNTAAREALQNYPESKIVDNNEKAIEKGIKEFLQHNEKRKKRENNKFNDNIEIIKQIKKVIEN